MPKNCPVCGGPLESANFKGTCTRECARIQYLVTQLSKSLEEETEKLVVQMMTS
jgi:hypothetical protein